MKIIKYISITFIFGTIILINSCKEKNLEVANPNELSPETYFKTETQVAAAVNASYGNMQTTGLYNRVMWFANDNMSHEGSGSGGLEADKRQYLDFSYDATHGAIEAYWASCYNGIKKANLLINNVDKIALVPTELMSDEKKAKYVGEAKFLRAFYHWLLVVRFGAVPISLGDPTAVGLPRSAVADVYAQIEKDLNEAIPVLLTKEVEQKGRATKGAAYALLGKVLLYQQRYAEALTAFNSMTGYDLDPVFFNNFSEETEHNIESVFEVEFNKGAGYSAQWNSDRTDAGLNEATFRGQEYGFDWNNALVSQNCIHEFETAAQNGVKDDPRLAYSIYIPKTIIDAGTGLPVTNRIVYNNDKDTIEYLPLQGSDLSLYPRAKWRKYSVYYKQSAVLDNCTGVNFRPIRYADVLLMMAECEANRPGGSLVTAVGYMNRVRARADVDMPLYGTAPMNAIWPVGNLTEFMNALEHERKVELCGEFHRWNDLIRWGKATQFITNLVAGTTHGGIYGNELPYDEIGANQFQSYKLLWAIPQNELNNNPGLKPADQNPGYN
jgi:starch-binding outer membrane protein, SusD/RagB family